MLKGGFVNRFIQYFKALTASIKNEDYNFLNNFLNKKEIEYFMRLPVYEMRHSLDVCYALINKYGINDDELLKAALFHDIGKIRAKITVNRKSVAVLIKKIPKLARYLEKRLYFLHVYYNHPAYSGEILKEMDLSNRIIYIVEHHHDKGINDEEILKLQMADKEN